MSEPYNDLVSNPSHYKHPSGVECKEIIYDLSGWIANSVKYVWRYPHKGKPVEDLRKSQECLRAATVVRLFDISSVFDYSVIVEKAKLVVAHESEGSLLRELLEIILTGDTPPDMSDISRMIDLIEDEIERYSEYDKAMRELYEKEMREAEICDANMREECEEYRR